MPPNFNEMPDPSPGTQRPQEQTPHEKAQEALLGKKAKRVNKSSESEIRQIVNKEAREDKGEESFIKKFVGVEDEKSGEVIDPDEEYEKLNGKPHPGKVKDES